VTVTGRPCAKDADERERAASDVPLTGVRVQRPPSVTAVDCDGSRSDDFEASLDVDARRASRHCSRAVAASLDGLAPRGPSSSRVRRTPLRDERRVEPVPMGHCAIGPTSTWVEPRRSSSDNSGFLLVPRAPSSSRVRRTPLRDEGRVEPVPMGHCAIGPTSTWVEPRRGSSDSSGFLLLDLAASEHELGAIEVAISRHELGRLPR
jgi:hypothetical protein